MIAYSHVGPSVQKQSAEVFADVYANGKDANLLLVKIKELTSSQYLKYKKDGH